MPIHSRIRPYWPAIATFYATACAISWPFFWWFNMHPQSWTKSAVPAIARWAGLMWGPGIAALLCFAIFQHRQKRTITFCGNSTLRSACFYLFPMLLLWFTHPSAARVSLGLINHPERLTGPSGPLLYLAFTFMIFVYALGEELGWRGFLQDALRPLPFIRRFL